MRTSLLRSLALSSLMLAGGSNALAERVTMTYRDLSTKAPATCPATRHPKVLRRR